LDKETRGYIEGVLDGFLQTKMVTDIEWIQNEIPISSLRDLAVGHAVTLMTAFAINIIMLKTREKPSKDDQEAIRIMVKRRLPELVGNIERDLGR
jgi:hypothetical protein